MVSANTADGSATSSALPSAPRTRSTVLLLGFCLQAAGALFVSLTSLAEVLPGVTHWMVASAAAALGAWYFNKGPSSDVLASISALLAVAAMFPAGGPANPSGVLVATGIIVFWAGIVLPRALAAVVAGFALVSPWLFGMRVHWINLPREVGEMSFFLHLLAVGLTFSLAQLLSRQHELLATRLEGRLREVRRREAELQAQVAEQLAELELSKEKLAQAQKLETVGTMASGLAHELNNLLVPIRGLAEVVAVSSEDDRTQHYGRRILDAAESAAAITGALLTYARQGNFAPIRTNLRHLIEKQVFAVLSRSIPEAIDVRLELEDHVACDVDRVMLQQALTNLVFNAIDAMPQGGSLVVKLYAQPAAQGLGSAVIEVADDGEGISPEVMEHIFDPFFTTKDVGAGTGLGLAMVQGCVTRHGGEIEVHSEPGEGARFVMTFPQAQERKVSRPWPVLGERRDRPVVVVVSEDIDTLDELEEMLHDLEITPICTAEIDTIRTMLAEVGDRVNMLLIDLGDDVDGTRRLVRDARRLRPDMSIIAVSSGPPDAGLQRLAGPGPLRMARGPVDPQMMATLLSDLLRPEGYELPYWALPSAGSGAHMSGSHLSLGLSNSSDE